MFINSGFTYLAAPYTDPNQAVRDRRIEHILSATAKLLNEGICVFSPIGHTHQLERMLRPDLAKDHAFWMVMDIMVLKHATSLSVLMIPGWQKSKGVREEIAIAKACKIPIVYLPPSNEYGDYAKYFTQPNENRIE